MQENHHVFVLSNLLVTFFFFFLELDLWVDKEFEERWLLGEEAKEISNCQENELLCNPSAFLRFWVRE